MEGGPTFLSWLGTNLIYDGSVPDRMRNPLEWVPLDSSDPLMVPPHPILGSIPMDYPRADPSGADSSFVLLLIVGPRAQGCSPTVVPVGECLPLGLS